MLHHSLQTAQQRVAPVVVRELTRQQLQLPQSRWVKAICTSRQQQTVMVLAMA